MSLPSDLTSLAKEFGPEIAHAAHVHTLVSGFYFLPDGTVLVFPEPPGGERFGLTQSLVEAQRKINASHGSSDQ